MAAERARGRPHLGWEAFGQVARHIAILIVPPEVRYGLNERLAHVTYSNGREPKGAAGIGSIQSIADALATGAGMTTVRNPATRAFA